MGKREILAFALIFLFVIVSRFAFLEERVLHHDEGVNYFFADKIISGEGFKYNPFDYHGPFYFFAIALSFLIFGISEFSLRFPAVLFGVLLALTPFLFRIGERREKYFISIFLLLSPSILYYSRYSIHEISFVFFSLVAIYYFSKILEKGNLEHLPIFAGAVAFLFIIKETVIIFLGVFFVMGMINWKRIKELKFKKNFGTILFSALIFILIYASFFTSFFTNFWGFGDSFKGFMPWMERGVNEIGHDKPFFYYINLILKYELPILLLALLGIFYIFGGYKRKDKNIFIASIGVWFVFGILIYSLIPYKTPWLIINFTTPMAFLGGFALARIWEKWKVFSLIILVVSIVYLGYFSLNTSFIRAESNDFAYVHTDRNILNLVGKINENYKEGDRILIVSEKYWPLPFYLRGKSVNYLDSEEFYNYTDYEEYNFFIFRERALERVGLLEGWRSEEFRLHPGERLVLVWRKE